MRGLLVKKFGGTSVGSPEKIIKIADQLAEDHKKGTPLIVVVSAMGDSTDHLIDLAHQVSKNPSGREMDMLLTTGERISMALLSMALLDRGVPAISFTGSQSGIVTTDSHRRAQILRIMPNRIQESLDQKKLVIVAGFQGVSEKKEITTLGRGGSDTTAVAIAAALKADRCEIFTDVDGIFSADPRKVSSAQFWDKIPAELMIEMSHRGAGVLHPRSVELAAEYAVDLWVRNSFGGSRSGTQIFSVSETERDLIVERYSVTGVVADRSKLGLCIELARSNALTSLWTAVSEARIGLHFAQIQGNQLWAFSDWENKVEWDQCLQKLQQDGFVSKYKWKDDLVPVSVVGYRMGPDCSAAKTFSTCLADKGVETSFFVATPTALVSAVPKDSADTLVSELHHQFFSTSNK